MAIQLNFNQMYFFYMVALHEGVRNAAKFLNVSPPAVSAQIKRFEESVGFPLLTRARGKLHLTEHGKKIFPEVEKIFIQAEHLEKYIHLLQEEHKNEFKLGGHFMHMQCIIPKLMPHFAALKKQCSLQLTVDFQQTLRDKLLNKELHMALMENCSLDEDLEVHELFRCKVVVVVCAQNPLGKEGPLYLRDLEDLPLLLPRDDSGFSTLLKDFFVQQDFVPSHSESFTLPICKRFVPQSSYVAFFPEYFVDLEFDSKHYRRVYLEDALPELSVSLACSKESGQSAMAQQVLASMPQQEELSTLFEECRL